MFNFDKDLKWKTNLKDKMITFIDLYRKEIKKPIENIYYDKENNDDNRIIITFVFKNIEITFEGIEDEDNKWMHISIEHDIEDKNEFDKNYNLIMKLIKNTK